jgi:hypothetical protein
MCYPFYKKDDVTGDWRRLHNEELYDLCCSPDIIRAIKSRIIIWVGHVARRKTEGMHISICGGYLREREHLEEAGVDGKIILKRIFKKVG